MNTISLLVLNSTNLINESKKSKLQNTKSSISSNVFKTLLENTKSVPKNIQSVIEGILISLFCTNASVVSFSTTDFTNLLLIDFIDVLPACRPLELFTTKFLLTHRQALASNDVIQLFIDNCVSKMLEPVTTINPIRLLPKCTFELLLLCVSIASNETRLRSYTHITNLLNTR